MSDEHHDKDEAEGMTSADFHGLAQKQIMNAVFSTLAESKMQWNLIEPFLESARAVCAADFEQAHVKLHVMRGEGEGWVEAEEAFLGISVADRDTGQEWLSQTWWLSDVATQDASREEVQAVIAALERTTAKLRDWLASGGKKRGGPAETEPPAEDQAEPKA
jgi:hypothetical protein